MAGREGRETEGSRRKTGLRRQQGGSFIGEESKRRTGLRRMPAIEMVPMVHSQGLQPATRKMRATGDEEDESRKMRRAGDEDERSRRQER